MAVDLDGVEQWRLGVRYVAMDSRRRTTLSGVVVMSMAERPGKVNALTANGMEEDLAQKEVKQLATNSEISRAAD
ncbi:Peroxidase 70 [Hordeum vulgare]|nr:Peroxidase 70 [Hordeum vulgare]